MTDTDLQAPTTAATDRARARAAGGLKSMVLPELRGIAAEFGIKGVSALRKGELIEAIEAKQGGAARAASAAAPLATPISTPPVASAGASAPAGRGARNRNNGAGTGSANGATGADAPAPAAPSAAAPSAAAPATAAPATTAPEAPVEQPSAPATNTDRAAAEVPANSANTTAAPAEAPRGNAPRNDGSSEDGGEQPRERTRNRNRNNRNNRADGTEQGQGNAAQGQNGNQANGNQANGNQAGGAQNRQGNRQNNQNGNNQNGNGQNKGPASEDGDDELQGRRGRRFRERRRGRDRNPDGEPSISEDDVLQPVAGILDVLDNYAFVRTSGYLAGPQDVYVSMNLVRRNGLRRGDALTGAVKAAREGEGGGNQSNANNRAKYNPLVRLDTVNGLPVEAAKNRPEFAKLTPLYPNQRLRLETTQNILTTRVIDLIMPIGKGQRALIVSPPKAGKTSVMQAIANAIAINNPECYLMVVLVDERPEEVTDMERSVRGEVISSTFDRPPGDHTAVAELAIERAKRLVESGRDVVVLLDSITRLGRAYNNSSPASGRILSGGVDSTALFPPKRFLGAARNIENGGSLTIIASALVETGSTGDTVIYEEFKGTGNAELKLDRKIAERRVFPAVDINPSGTRKDELLLASDEAAIVHKLRRLLSGLDSQQAIDTLISQLKKTSNNVEFLMTFQKNSGVTNLDDD